jgi:hypothetical protein
MLIGNSRLVNPTVSREDIAIMRIRIIWMILMQPDLTTTSNKIARAFETTDIALLATVKA